MKSLWLIWFLICTTSVAQELRVETVAGTGAPENNGDVGSASTINVGDPFGVELGPNGGLYVTEVRNHRVRRVDLATREVTTIAGCGRRGYSGDGGPAIEAELNEPYEVRFDAAGNMYIVEMKNQVVRRVDAKTNVISTIAGTGKQGFGGDGGPATQAQLSQPHSIALDGRGAVYIADIGNHRIRRVDPESGTIETVAGNSERKLPRDGQVARGNPMLGPRALYIDRDTLWIALREGHSIWRMDVNEGKLRHVAGTGRIGFSGDGDPATAATFNGPKGIAVSRTGKVFVVDSGNNAVRSIDLKTGVITTVIGRGPEAKAGGRDHDFATDARLRQPHGICVAAEGTLFIGDTLNHRVCRIGQ